MEPLQKVTELAETLASLRPLDREQEAIIMQKFRLDWNYNSNNLEGNSLTFGETKALILFGITAQGKPLKDHVEITGHDEAIKWVTDLVDGEYPLTENFIRELHTLLLKEPYEVKAQTPDGKPTTRTINVGQYKTSPNHVLTKTGEVFRFATPEETPAKMHDLITWYREKSEEPGVNAVILAAEFHYRFIRIHPFDDGNGRTARIIMNFILMKFGYPPAVIKTEDKANYFSALQQADAGIIQPFIDYIAVTLTRSLEIMIAGAKGESIEEPDDVDKQIVLLEQRLKQHRDQTKLSATSGVLIELYNNSLARLWSQFLIEARKFGRFYSKHFVMLRNNSVNFGFHDNAFSDFKVEFNEHIKKISFDYNFSNFNHPSMASFSYTSSIELGFNQEYYEVKFGDQTLQKEYGQQLTDKEIEIILKTLSKAHAAVIDKKIEEAKR